MVPRDTQKDPEILNTRVFGLSFSNPLGLAAGFDKNGIAVDGLLKMGFGFVEVGSITPKRQDGNPHPRVFRLIEDKAVINRYGFNSEGHEQVRQHLQYQENNNRQGILGVNLGKNKTSEDAVADYIKGVECFGSMGDYLVINISSPNTPGLRAMQGKEQLTKLIDEVIVYQYVESFTYKYGTESKTSIQPITARKIIAQPIRMLGHDMVTTQHHGTNYTVLTARNKLPERPPVMVKIAPDLTPKDKEDIAAVITRSHAQIDGIIISNTTVLRPSTLKSKNSKETGGLSGEPLTKMSTEVIKDMYKLTNGTLPIIGVGGISTGQDAYDKIKAGASLVQLYTALVYHGPPIIKQIKRELTELLRKDGFNSVSEAVGIDHQRSA
ncbi:hypothetical protein QZH41_012893 [Actinostola sp. cb2023]|nr:hypothetical protein QZH41_012893 [Actinostola sp. cb2023]